MIRIFILLFAGLSLLLPVAPVKRKEAEVQAVQQKETAVYISKYHQDGWRCSPRSQIKVSKTDAAKNGAWEPLS